jgi:death-on-curing protein
MYYLTADEIVGMQAKEVPPELGLGLRDRRLLEAAVDRPRSSAGGDDAFPDIHAKAAALFHSLASTQPFLDGNKRTAVVAMYTFYGYNGYHVWIDQGELFDVAREVAVRKIDTVDEIAQILKGWALPIDESELPDAEPPPNR